MCKYCGVEDGFDLCEKCEKRHADLLGMDKAPCSSSCVAREIGCHSKCEPYLVFKELHNDRKLKERMDHVASPYYFNPNFERYVSEKQKIWTVVHRHYHD